MSQSDVCADADRLALKLGPIIATKQKENKTGPNRIKFFFLSIRRGRSPYLVLPSLFFFHFHSSSVLSGWLRFGQKRKTGSSFSDGTHLRDANPRRRLRNRPHPVVPGLPSFSSDHGVNGLPSFSSDHGVNGPFSHRTTETTHKKRRWRRRRRLPTKKNLTQKNESSSFVRLETTHLT